MNQPDEAIERVLAGVRDAEAPTGMEARIMDALAAHAARKNSWRGWMTERKYAWPVAGGAAVMGVFVAAFFVASMHRAGQAADRGTANGVRMVASSGNWGGVEEVVPQRLKPQRGATHFGTAKAMPLSKAAGGAGTHIPGQGNGEEGHPDFDSLAVSEMLAPSKPAPPLPLTHQEVLLAQVAHHGDPAELAELRPEIREKQMEIARAEFHEFFEPMPLVKNNEKPKL